MPVRSSGWYKVPIIRLVSVNLEPTSSMVPKGDCTTARATTLLPALSVHYKSKAHLQAVAQAAVAQKVASSKLLSSSNQNSTVGGVEGTPKFVQ